jgi:hypothetical protein
MNVNDIRTQQTAYVHACSDAQSFLGIRENFLGDPSITPCSPLTTFSDTFPDKNVFIAFVALSPHFYMPNFGTLPEKQKYFARKITGASPKMTRAAPPPKPEALGNMPPPPFGAPACMFSTRNSDVNYLVVINHCVA